MPLYDLKCKKCGHFEEDVLMKTHKNKISCSKCQGMMTRRIGTQSFKLIGQGFYKNDHYKMKLGVKDGKGNRI